MGVVKMDLDTALDDLDGLFEAFRALADDTRKSALRRNADALNLLAPTAWQDSGA